MKNYKLVNNILGWFVFIIASLVYILTAEPTTSFWDCGEYIATAYKLQVGHPPGAPFFQMLGRFFSLFAFGDTTQVAKMINYMSAFSSSFTILFLFWTITAFARKIALKNGELTEGKFFAIMGSGLVGALAYAFSDTFWFSAVEGEVYAMSSFFTAVTFWAILKWERVADQQHSLRWIILIAFLIGISIGVHLLNLLAIPAVVFVYYFKKSKKVSRKGVILVFLASVALLYTMLYIIIPMFLKFAGAFELFFVNSVGLPFNSGTIIYFVLLTAIITSGIYYSHKKGKVILNTIMLALTFIIIGYSSFFMLVIRSNGNTPIDENNPEDAVNLLAYLNREQYGYTPLIYGPYYNSPKDFNNPYKTGTPKYAKDEEKGEYITIRKNESDVMRPNYIGKFCTFFPRMHSNRAPRGGFDAYNSWVEIKGKNVSYTNPRGERETLTIPTFGENLRYFFKYQLGYMYFRYFMWNFAGRQNDIQGSGGLLYGNWLSGINFIDEARLGPQDVPEHLQSKANNKYYFLPLILGLIGLFFHMKKHHKDAFIIALLFFFTGIAIVIYLNQAPNEPRERDYAYAASFYAFAIWIGLGVMAIWNFLEKKLNGKTAAIISTSVCTLLVPVLMAQQNWDDHDRSNRYTALASANNYLNSCAPNAILFTNGDNDTFPLWYAQEVDGIRTDIKVVNLSLLSSGWYVEQITRKSYDADPVPHTIPYEKYRMEDFDFTYFIENKNIQGHIDLKDLIDFVNSNDPKTKFDTPEGLINYFPTKNFSLAVDSAQIAKQGFVPPKYLDSLEKEIKWRLNRSGVMRNHQMVLDMLASNNWERPIYFAITTGNNSYLGLQNYFRLEGMAYRLVPYKTKSLDGQFGEVYSDGMYANLMNKYQYGNINSGKIYVDETNLRMIHNLKNNFARLTNTLLAEGKKDSTLKACNKCYEEMPPDIIPVTRYDVPLAEAYFKAGDIEKGKALFEDLLKYSKAELDYFSNFTGGKASAVSNRIKEALAIVHRTISISERYKLEDLQKDADEVFKTYYGFAR